uniref:Uncharacterized protein n=1 Tax=Romanomermis culicivorax TaxID=13658 RepID=A0A915HJX5_ROMCU
MKYVEGKEKQTKTDQRTEMEKRSPSRMQKPENFFWRVFLLGCGPVNIGPEISEKKYEETRKNMKNMPKIRWMEKTNFAEQVLSTRNAKFEKV